MQYAVQFDYTNLYTLTFVYVHSQHRRSWHCVQGTKQWLTWTLIWQLYTLVLQQTKRLTTSILTMRLTLFPVIVPQLQDLVLSQHSDE